MGLPHLLGEKENRGGRAGVIFMENSVAPSTWGGGDFSKLDKSREITLLYFLINGVYYEAVVFNTGEIPVNLRRQEVR